MVLNHNLGFLEGFPSVFHKFSKSSMLASLKRGLRNLDFHLKLS